MLPDQPLFKGRTQMQRVLQEIEPSAVFQEQEQPVEPANPQQLGLDAEFSQDGDIVRLSSEDGHTNVGRLRPAAQPCDIAKPLLEAAANLERQLQHDANVKLPH